MLSHSRKLHAGAQVLEGQATYRAEERQQGSSVTMTPHAGHCRVRAPERISWELRGQKIGRRPWPNARITQLQGLRESWPCRSCIPQQELYSLPLSEVTFIHWVCLFILLERRHCLSSAGAATRDEHDPLATSPQTAKCRWSK